MKTTYQISFYPGWVIDRRFFVTVDNQTSDYGALVDMLADKLWGEYPSQDNPYFDNDCKLSDDAVVVAGNSGMRLITGGSLHIEEVTTDTIKHIIQEKAGTDSIFGICDIGFADGDETEFEAANADELTQLWIDFCKENDFEVVDIDYVEIKYRNQQIHTERGSLYVVGSCSEDLAISAGYYYAWTSSELGKKLYTKPIDESGRRRVFVIIEDEE